VSPRDKEETLKQTVQIIALFFGLAVAGFAEEKPITYRYPEVGLTLFTPGGFNAMFGYSMDDVTIRGVGMSLGKTFGFQTEYDYNLGRSNYYKNGPGLVLGYMDYSNETGKVHVTTNGKGVRGLIVGAHYFWNWGLFYSSVGLAYTAINPNTSPPITMLFNIGINRRFLHGDDS
jgi:hypothetical protein